MQSRVVRRESGRLRLVRSAFELKFHLLTEFADLTVAIYEKDSGGEAVELGLLRQDHCFSHTVALPRDYYGVGQDDFDGKDEVLDVARHIAFADDLDDGHQMPLNFANAAGYPRAKAMRRL